MGKIIPPVCRQHVCNKALENELISATGRLPASKANLALRLARDGEWVSIVAINGGKGLHERLAGVGLRIGAEVQILNNPMNGKMLIGHNGSRLFLGGGMAQKIQVTVMEGGEK